MPSPNIWQRPDVYELLNAAADPDGLVDGALSDVRPLRGARVLDVGCGTGFHLPRLAATADEVVGVEPHPRLVELARRRVEGSAAAGRVSVQRGTAQWLPVADRSVDLVLARWAYFFGPGCEPGLTEAWRVLRPGGALAVVDLDPTASGYSHWFRRAWPRYAPAAVERFWALRGFARRPLAVCWRFGSRADLAAVLGAEFPPAVAREALAATPGLVLEVPQVLRSHVVSGRLLSGVAPTVLA